jgi:PBP1b-binding outer membrane lipoprotein LpoB
MKIGYIFTLFTSFLITSCSNEAVALNEYKPKNKIIISSIVAEITAKDIAKVRKRRNKNFNNY